MALVDDLLSAEPRSTVSTMTQWWDALGAQRGEPFEVAARVAARSDRLAWVFASGYHGALRSLFGVAAGRRAALCVTEDAGNTARAIATRYDGGNLHGTKSFVTFGDRADELLVLASRGEQDGRKDLVIVRALAAPEAVLSVMRTAFMPEIAHARVAFDGAPAELVLEDAWPVVKAFRYVEDVFVLGTTLAWLAGLSARHGQVERAAVFAGLSLSAQGLSAADPGSAAAHLAFDGFDTIARREIDAVDWAKYPTPIGAMWLRDRAVLDIAGGVRRARAELARASIREG